MQNFLKSILLTFSVCLIFSESKGQTFSSYLDSIKGYQIFVDSLILAYSSNPATTLRHAVLHYSCVDSTNSYGSGGSTDLYQDSSGDMTYQLYDTNICDTAYSENTFYFLENKIVLAIIQNANLGQRKNYYRNDKLIKVDGLVSVDKTIPYKELTNGYRLFKSFK